MMDADGGEQIKQRVEGLALPRHVAIVMDGNGRWAQRHGEPRHVGHRVGVRSVRKVVESCGHLGIEALTLFAFSSENWRRPRGEIRVLLELFRSTLDQELERLHENKVRIRFIGDRAQFGTALQQRLAQAERLTAENDGLTLVIATSYGGRWDIAQAAREIASAVAEGRLDPQAVGEEAVREALSVPDLPEPDLFIRTGGEQRLSNFRLWQIAYAELHFTDTLWPDFSDQDLAAALEDYASRCRRFGGVEAPEALSSVRDA